jgi:two-component system response regulator HydG
MPEFRVLVVDDEVEARRLLTQALGKEFETASAADGSDALQQIERQPCEVVLLDYAMPGINGMEVLRRIKASHPEIRVIMVTALDDLSFVIETIRAGAEDYVVKPIVIDAVKQKIRAFHRERDLAVENHRLRTELDQRHRFEELLGQSPAFMAMLGDVERVSPLQIPVLIYGESGTGKELVARAIHDNSSRKNEAFLGINCAAFHDTLLASELFGHVRGAFTDAREAKKGLFAAANDGTLFLDEIGEISASFQAQLLRVLQTGEILPVGSTTPKPVDVRIIAATNRDLQEEVERGRFREDLYFRLWKFPLRVPPLRERREDIPILAKAFLQRYKRDLNKDIQGFTDDAIRLLLGYAWPGNVRELENAIERAAILEDGERIHARDLLLGRDRHGDVSDGQFFEGEWQEAKRRFEKAYLVRVMAETGGNISQAARKAGIERGNFREKLSTYGLLTRDIRTTEP